MDWLTVWFLYDFITNCKLRANEIIRIWWILYLTCEQIDTRFSAIFFFSREIEHILFGGIGITWNSVVLNFDLIGVTLWYLVIWNPYPCPLIHILNTTQLVTLTWCIVSHYQSAILKVSFAIRKSNEYS